MKNEPYQGKSRCKTIGFVYQKAVTIMHGFTETRHEDPDIRDPVVQCSRQSIDRPLIHIAPPSAQQP